MYYCLTGNYPFTADATGTAESMRISILNDQPRHILEAAEACSATISSHTGNIVMQGLQKNINDRFPSAKTMLDTVLAAIDLVRSNLRVVDSRAQTLLVVFCLFLWLLLLLLLFFFVFFCFFVFCFLFFLCFCF